MEFVRGLTQERGDTKIREMDTQIKVRALKSHNLATTCLDLLSWSMGNFLNTLKLADSLCCENYTEVECCATLTSRGSVASASSSLAVVKFPIAS